MCMQNVIKLFQMVEELYMTISVFSHFCPLRCLGQRKWHLAIPLARACQYSYGYGLLSKYAVYLKARGDYHICTVFLASELP